MYDDAAKLCIQKYIEIDLKSEVLERAEWTTLQ